MPDLALRADLETRFAEHRTAAAKDPFTNPYLLFALGLTRRMEAEIDLDAIEAVIRDVAADGFAARAERLGAYLDHPDPERGRGGVARPVRKPRRAGLRRLRRRPRRVRRRAW